jgi:drug/metabolite transporter (DMT)-like permease
VAVLVLLVFVGLLFWASDVFSKKYSKKPDLVYGLLTIITLTLAVLAGFFVIWTFLFFRITD